jgi:hypothetical protein
MLIRRFILKIRVNTKNQFSTCQTLLSRSYVQQDVFKFEPSKLEGASSKNSTDYKRIPVILLLGWAGCIDKHLSKYHQIYHNLGYHTIRLSPSITFTFLSRYKTHYAVANQLLDSIKSNKK